MPLRSLAKIVPTSSGSVMPNGAGNGSHAIDPTDKRAVGDLLDRAQAVAHGEALLLEAIRVARSETKAPQSDSYVRNLAKQWLTKGFTAGLKQLLVLLHDCHKRGAPETSLLTVAESLRAIIEGWYSERALACIHETHEAETRNEGQKNVIELRLVKERTPTAAVAYLRAHEDHRKCNEELAAHARRMLLEAVTRKTRPAPQRS